MKEDFPTGQGYIKLKKKFKTNFCLAYLTFYLFFFFSFNFHLYKKLKKTFPPQAQAPKTFFRIQF